MEEILHQLVIIGNYEALQINTNNGTVKPFTHLPTGAGLLPSTVSSIVSPSMKPLLMVAQQDPLRPLQRRR